MQDLGDQIAAAARELLATPAFRRRFARWTIRYPPLAEGGGPQGLLEGLRGKPYSVRDGVLAALVRLVQEDDPDAPLFLLRMLRPGIAARVRFLPVPREEAWQELAAGLLWAVRRYDPARRPTGIAHNLLQAGLRHASARLLPPLELVPAEDVPEETCVEEPEDHAAGLLAEAVEARAIDARDAALIGRTRLQGYRLTELAPCGSYERLQKRRRRAEARLRVFLEDHHPELVRSRQGTRGDGWGEEIPERSR